MVLGVICGSGRASAEGRGLGRLLSSRRRPRPYNAVMGVRTDTSSTAHDGQPQPCRHAFRAFDTLVVLDLWGDGAACDEAAAAAARACAECESLFSRTLPESDIGRLNQARGAWVDVDARTVDLLRAALVYCERSQGAFDVTVGPAVEQWDFRRGVVPDACALARAVAHVDWRGVCIDEAACRVRLEDAEAKVDLGGIAKGWIADRLSELLSDERFGLSGAVANLGGNVVVGGSKPGADAWRVGVKDPRDPSRNVAVIPVAAGSVVTSGTYERSFERDGMLCHHVLDPRTGWPVDTDLAGATLVCSRSIDAEGYSTTVLALGKKKGARFVNERPEIEHACLVGRDGELLLL